MIAYQDCRMEGGKLIITPDKESIGAAMNMVRESAGKKMSLEYKQFRRKRSLDANAYAWVLIGKIAKAIGIPEIEVYRNEIRNVGGASEVLCLKESAVEKFVDGWGKNGIGWMADDLGKSKIPGCRNVKIWYGSSTYDTAQMSRLIEAVTQDCKALGIETLTERELALLKEEWQ